MATVGIDFARLSLQDALDLAVLVEEEAEDRYRELADQLAAHRTSEAAEFFRFMIGNEAKHGRLLAARRHERFGAAPSTVRREMLFDVEAPAYDDARSSMSPRQAMKVALAAEARAQRFFADALPHVRDAEVRALFEELEQEERDHQRWVAAQLDRLGEGPDPDLAAFEDDPVAQ